MIRSVSPSSTHAFAVQLLGISNAIVDVLAHVDAALLEKFGAVPGSMTLVDEEPIEQPKITGACNS